MAEGAAPAGDTTANFDAALDAAADRQMQIAIKNAEISVEIAEANAIKKAFEKIQG
ncbi:MAG: hypothetical protein AAFR17_09125 [Pseudomonadota bacterium]